MTDQEARVILSAYRPDGQNADDPELAAALAHLQTSPALAAWFEQQLTADRAISRALQSITPPADLRARILAARSLPAPVRSWRAPLIGLAALLVALCGILSLARPGALPMKEWQHDSLTQLSSVVTGRTPLDLRNDSPSEVRHFLQASFAPVATPIPAPLMSLRTLGCHVFTWREQKVSIMCFYLSPKQLVHLITIEKPLLRGEEAPQFARHAGWNTATWVRGGKTYLLATKAEPAQLRQILL